MTSNTHMSGATQRTVVIPRPRLTMALNGGHQLAA